MSSLQEGVEPDDGAAPVSVAVGAVETSALAPFLTDDLRAQMESLTPMRRIGTPEDMAGAAIYLASRAGDYVVGDTIAVDGGIAYSRIE